MSGDRQALNLVVEYVAPNRAPDVMTLLKDNVAIQIARSVESGRAGLGLTYLQGLIASNAENLELLARIRAGDFDHVYQAVEHRVRGIIRGRIWPGLWDEAEQEARIAVWRCMQSYELDKGLFTAYVHASVAGQLKAMLRGRKPAPLALPSYVEAQDLPVPECWEELMKLVFENPPHFALCFLLCRVLGWSVEHVEADFLDFPLATLARRVEIEYVTRSNDPARARRPFRQIHEQIRTAGAGTLGSYCTRASRAHIADWSHRTLLHVLHRLLAMEVDLLETLFSMTARPHETLTLAYLRLVAWTLDDLWRESQATLFELLNEFPKRYPTSLDENKLKHPMDPLAQALAKPKLSPQGREQLRKRAEHSGNGKEALVAWREACQRELLRRCREDGRLAYSYLSGAIPGLPPRPAKKGVSHAR